MRFIAIILIATGFIIISTFLMRVRRVTFKCAELSSQASLQECMSHLLGRFILFARGDVSHLFADEPLVARAIAHIDLPYTVVVSLVRRKPVALIKVVDGLCAVSDEGLIYRRLDNALIGVSMLPLIASERLNGFRLGERIPSSLLTRFRRIISLLSSAGLHDVKLIEISEEGEITLQMNDGSILKLGSEVGLKMRLPLAVATYVNLRERIGQKMLIDARNVKGCIYKVLCEENQPRQ